jgi:HEAT repeat protein
MAQSDEELREFTERSLAESRRASAPLIEELRSIGIQTEIDDLDRNFLKVYPQALEVLVRHLELHYPDNIRNLIVTLLGVPKAKIAWQKIKTIYKKEPPSHIKNSLAFALSQIADDRLLPELIEMIKDSENGRSRIAFVRRIFKAKSKEATDTIIALKDDPDLKAEIQQVLKNKRII